MYPPCCSDSNWVAGSQRCFQVLYWVWIPNVARLIWVVDTQRCSAYLGCGYPTLLGLFGLWIPNVAWLIWVVDTQRCSGIFGS